LPANAASALYYRAKGWSVIPLRPRDKRPLVPWEGFQKRIATEQEVRGWFAKEPQANLGIVTGSISGLFVLDLDDRHGGNDSIDKLLDGTRHLPDSPFAFTGGKSVVPSAHLYFKMEGPTPTMPGLLPGVDLKGEGGYVVAPPSIHPDGGVYEWVVSPREVELLPAPGWLVADLIKQRRSSPAVGGGAPHDPSWVADLLQSGVGEGQRNESATRLAGYFRGRGMDTTTILAVMAPFAARCTPPLPERELETIVESVCRYPSGAQPSVPVWEL